MGFVPSEIPRKQPGDQRKTKQLPCQEINMRYLNTLWTVSNTSVSYSIEMEEISETAETKTIIIETSWVARNGAGAAVRAAETATKRADSTA
jgi:ribonuclease BN (tRNA processing enzyme)